ncbi:hypothetical protein [Azohydromonas caseinilytica]|uniref:Lipoprotein n=1 Tax=Azohydromonas caseinilytica TaxID=2728836 RepID=A0A848FEU3_9BURK|nr:hypothetical protein [Azohydromonas caseinilytica]NML18747.1 hypothetical protein [Azohydromonas caseinilytica]
MAFQNNRRGWRCHAGALAALAACAMFTGCTTAPLVQSAVSANLVQEEAHNKLLALNVARAVHRMPMHFTQISALRSAPYGFGLGIPGIGAEFALGADAANTLTLRPSLNASQNVDVTVLNEQDFFRGITTPLKSALLLYYLDQGWPMAVLLPLFVQSIEFFDENNQLKERVRNSPGGGAEFDRFRELVATLFHCEIDGTPTGEFVYYTGVLAGAQLSDPVGAAAARTAGLVPVAQGKIVTAEKDAAGGFQLAADNGDLSLTMVNKPGSTSCDQYKFRTGAAQDQSRVVSSMVATSRAGVDRPEAGEAQGATTRAGAPVPSAPAAGAPTAADKVNARLVLRSPEAMVYYLGELVRQQNESGRALLFPGSVSRDADFVLFDMPLAAPARSVFSFEYQGDTYHVPRYALDNRTVHVLSLLTQIIGLQNRGTTSPATANVRIVQ